MRNLDNKTTMTDCKKEKQLKHLRWNQNVNQSQTWQNSSEKVVFFLQSSERVVASSHLNIEMGLLHWYTIYDREETLNLEVIVV
jgi:hypothetical protein